jgi:hypothetical protein
MDYRKLTVETWNRLDIIGDSTGGYKSCWLALSDNEESDLHIFRDKYGKYHFAVEDAKVTKTDIDDPQVNGLQFQLISYRFENGKISQFIDLTCSISGYLVEFTEVVKEVSKEILEDKQQPLYAFNKVINNWLSFWSEQKKEILNEEEQIGLICELITLNKLCEINSDYALKSWTGPLGEKHDFNFSDWNFEVKGTRKSKRTHSINGIDQLNPPYNKRLGFISFQLTTSYNEHSINLTDLIESIIKIHFDNKPNLIVKLNDLLARTGYNPIHAEEYKKFKVEVIESTFFEVDENFPKLISRMLNEPLNTRVSSLRYDISLEGVSGTYFNKLNLGEYFY